MVDVDRLDSVINELESSTKSILKLSDVVNKTECMVAETKENHERLSQLVNVINEINKQSVESNEACKKTYGIIDDYCTKSSEINARFISQVNTLLLEMKNENNSLYKNFEGTITSKFDLFKSDVIVENRKIVNEINTFVGDGMKGVKSDIIANINDNSNATQKMILERMDNKTKMLTIYIGIAIIVSLANLAVQLTK